MIKAITGTKDILPWQISEWKRLEKTVENLMSYFNYKEIRTPTFEETVLFSRGIGEATDIVSKEMYTFIDRSETSITLKPEMTASVVRAYIEHKLSKKQNLHKLYYISSMYRQERPQAGRLREFHQFGAEAIGSNAPMLDAEMIELAYSILKSFGLKNLDIKINSLGVPAEREQYKTELRNYLKDKFELLSEDSKKRFETNILRIFDSKDEKDIEIMSEAPKILDFLSEESLKHFEEVKSYLDEIEIKYSVDYKLVRGLDYYTNTTFEIVSSSVGAQSALCGGGRYNLLIEQLGGPPTPATGFAAGMERILLACVNEGCNKEEEASLDIYLVRMEPAKKTAVFKISNTLRKNGLKTEMDYLSRSVKAQMREANRMNARFVLFVGGEEFEKGSVVLKDMETGEQQELPAKDLTPVISKLKNQ